MKNFKKIFLGIITTVLLLFGGIITLASGLEPYYKCPNCTGNDNNCTCYYNSSEKCYCEYLGFGISNCHDNCSYDSEALEFWNIAKIGIGILLVLFIIRTIILRQSFKKLGKKSRYSIVPIRNIHTIFKITGKKNWFWLNLSIFLISLIIFIFGQNTNNSFIGTLVILACISVFLSIINILKIIGLLPIKNKKHKIILISFPIVSIILILILLLNYSLVFNVGNL